MPEDSLHLLSGFVVVNDEALPVEDPDNVLDTIRRHSRNRKEIYDRLSGILNHCSRKGLNAAAYDYGEKMLLYASTPAEKAYCLLCMGIMKERVGEFAEALVTYLSAFDLTPERNDTWYFLNNNLGYCLNIFGRYDAAERRCRTAIEINPRRHNAYKNLGISLQGQGKYSRAAHALIRATRLCPEDQRALHHLEALIHDQKESLPDLASLMITLKMCRELAAERAIH